MGWLANATVITDPDEVRRLVETARCAQWGAVNPKIICPQCQVVGHVHTKALKRKAGISGGKVMGGLLTGGISLLGTGLSRKQAVTQAHCGNCDSTWDF